MEDAFNLSLLIGLSMTEGNQSVETIEQDIDIKPDATELLRAFISSLEYVTSTSTDSGNIPDGFKPKQEQITPDFGPAFCVENKNNNERVDRLFNTREELKSHFVPPKTEISFDNLLNSEGSHYKGLSLTPTSHPKLCAFGNNEKCILKQDNDSDFTSAPASQIEKRLVKNEWGSLVEKKTNPIIVRSAVDQLISGYPELENNIDGKYYQYCSVKFICLSTNTLYQHNFKVLYKSG